MPLYEYECRKCGHRFEALIIGSKLPRCPSCNSEDLERTVSAFAMSSEGRSGARRSTSGSCGTGGGGGG